MRRRCFHTFVPKRCLLARLLRLLGPLPIPLNDPAADRNHDRKRADFVHGELLGKKGEGSVGDFFDRLSALLLKTRGRQAIWLLLAAKQEDGAFLAFGSSASSFTEN